MHRLRMCTAVFAYLAMIAFGLPPSLAAEQKKHIQDFLDRHSDKIKCEYIVRHAYDYPVYECPMPVLDNVQTTSFSFFQEDSEIGSGGICGQVALANTIANLCNKLDYTPHVFDAEIQPKDNKGTIIEKLNEVLNEKLNMIYCRGERRFKASIARAENKQIRWVGEEKKPLSIAWMVRRYEDQPKGTFNPVIATLHMEGSLGHATTIVHVEESEKSCQVIHNTWGWQYRTSCDRFKQIVSDVIFLELQE